MDIYTLELLFAPTGVIQEISIDNGWGTKFLCIAEVVDQSREVENNWISPVFNGKSKDLSHELRE